MKTELKGFYQWMEYDFTKKGRQKHDLEQSMKASKEDKVSGGRECPVCEKYPCKCGYISIKQWSKRKDLGK